MSSSIKNFFRNITRPTSKNEDKARREFIFNVIVLSIIILSFAVLCMHTVRISMGLGNAIPIAVAFILFAFFGFLYFLSRKGHARLSSFILLTIFCLLVSYMQYKWGVDLPMAILSQALIIVMTGVLINTRAAFATTVTISSIIATIAYLQNTNAIAADRYWITDKWIISDVIVASVLFLIIATVSWLSNREIEKSLKRARRSEAELKKERDLLEITVEQRTKELKEVQAEKMSQLYRFAEFGRISSGLFHDLINPLNAVSLNMEKIKSSNQNVMAQVKQIEGQTGAVPLSEAAGYVEKAIQSAKKLENMVTAVRQQLVRHENKAVFSLNQEIEYVVEVLSHKAKKAGVEIRFSAEKDISMFGEGVKFNQIALNLIANAVDSYSGEHKKERIVDVRLEKNHIKTTLEVADNGGGIPQENITKIFEPFFTTKQEGLGLGLSITKRIVEKDFYGTLSVSSEAGKGTTFTVQIPNKNEQKSSTGDR